MLRQIAEAIPAGSDAEAIANDCFLRLNAQVMLLPIH